MITVGSPTADDLNRFDLFADVGRDHLDALAGGSTVERFSRKEIIMSPESDLSGIVVANGEARLFRLSGKGVEITIAMLGTGDSYLFPATVPGMGCVCLLEASQDGTTIYRLPTEPLRALTARNPAFSYRILTIAAHTMTMLTDRLEEHVTSDVRTRLAHALASMDAGPDTPILATHQELAALIGTSQTQVTKALAHLRRTGLVSSSYRRRGTLVLEPELLAHYGETHPSSGE